MSARTITKAEQDVLDAVMQSTLGAMARKDGWGWTVLSTAIYCGLIGDDDRLGQPITGEWEEHLRRLARVVCDACLEIAGSISGEPLYLAKTCLLTKRNQEMMTKFNGRNAESLAREYGITTRWFYKILSIDRKIRQERSQLKLPLE